MRNATRGVLLTMASLAACGDDGTTTSSSSSSSSGATSSGAQAGSTCGPDGGTCASGLVCCAPRPDVQGVCQAERCELDSDRDIKEAFARVDRADVLDKLVGLAITEWTYVRDRDRGVRHIGPMAQDFRRTFGLGASERHINPVDAHGVTIAAVQALHDRVLALEAELATLRRRPKPASTAAAKKKRLRRR